MNPKIRDQILLILPMTLMGWSVQALEGSDGVRRKVTHSITLGWKSVSEVYCPEGLVVVTGGCEGAHDVTLSTNKPLFQNSSSGKREGWICQASGGLPGGKLTAIAICTD